MMRWSASIYIYLNVLTIKKKLFVLFLLKFLCTCMYLQKSLNIQIFLECISAEDMWGRRKYNKNVIAWTIFSLHFYVQMLPFQISVLSKLTYLLKYNYNVNFEFNCIKKSNFRMNCHISLLYTVSHADVEYKN